VTTSFDKVHMI